MINNNLVNKKYFLHFLPEQLQPLTKDKYIEYKNRRLKVSYIIDIVNGLILKYYFKKINQYSLSSIVLKDKYGFNYNYYINYLIDNKILILIKNYKNGVSSRIYSLNDNIFKGNIKRHRNYDNILLKKYKKRMLSKNDNYIDYISVDIKEKLINDLYTVKIDTDKSSSFISSLKNINIDVFNRNSYSIDSINDGHIFYHFDKYGRLHTNFTILRSFIRKNCIIIDGGSTCELDIPNSQPLFLYKLIKESNSQWVNKDELSLFKELTTNGVFYDYLIQNITNAKDKSNIKEMVYKVLFGKNNHNSKADKLFKGIFPTIYQFIKLYKKEHNNYKILSHNLQRMESDLIFNKIIKNIMEFDKEIKIITIHDSIIFNEKYKEVIKVIFDNELKKEFNEIYEFNEIQ